VSGQPATEFFVTSESNPFLGVRGLAAIPSGGGAEVFFGDEIDSFDIHVRALGDGVDPSSAVALSTPFNSYWLTLAADATDVYLRGDNWVARMPH
jgi:hypothetical protein